MDKNDISPLIVAAFLAVIVISLIVIFLSAGGPVYTAYDHYVSFTMRADSLAPGYAYDLAARGEPGDNPWVYNIYLFGKDSSGQDGRVAVYGYSRGGWILASPVSAPLVPCRTYTIIWRYNATSGGELFIDGIIQGEATGGGPLDTNLSSSFHLGKNMLLSPLRPARPHSAFNGEIWEGIHYEKDLNLYEENITCSSVTASECLPLRIPR